MLYLDINYDGAKGYYVDWSDYALTIGLRRGQPVYLYGNGYGGMAGR